ncbi:MAG: T9SS type A sorting domain-containing protein [Saprospiraceae bacterium]|nr:T9SS type A sorting domain-containing protein [Saprospiraceae bacterium]
MGPCTNITGGEFDSTYDAGLLILAAIGDFVWHDLNGNGQQNGGEPGMAGVQVNLYKGDGSYVGTTYTDVNGYYLFDFLYPGNYYLEFIDPAGFEQTFFNRGSDVTDSDVDRSNGPRTTATTYLAPGERDMTWDAGYYKCIPIGDLVWYDINKNDIWNTNENGINGLKVNLWRNHFGTWMIWDFKYTGHKPGTPSDDGYWKFCAPPGEYYVEVIMPPLGLVRARANVGTNEENDSDITNANGPTTTDKFTVLSGQEKCDLGAGFYPMAQAGNLVWRDANVNGIQESNEPKVEGVKVEAIEKATGKVAATTLTDSDGTYNINYLEQQAYYLRFSPPAGYGATLPRRVSDDMDSDVDHSNGSNTTRTIEFISGKINENIDMGIAFGVLPVDWLDVNARRVNNIHEITWSTAKEVNASHYEVERRMESDAEFKLIPGKVPAKGNTSDVSNYSLNDQDVDKPGVYVYRVKQTDFDGQYTYSKLVSVSHSGTLSVSLYPNPAKEETNINVMVGQDSKVEIELFDSASKLIASIKPSDAQKAGETMYNLKLNDVPAGVYNVVITINGQAVQKKLIRIE